jgi:hypothetical protein
MTPIRLPCRSYLIHRLLMRRKPPSPVSPGSILNYCYYCYCLSLGLGGNSLSSSTTEHFSAAPQDLSHPTRPSAWRRLPVQALEISRRRQDQSLCLCQVDRSNEMRSLVSRVNVNCTFPPLFPHRNTRALSWVSPSSQMLSSVLGPKFEPKLTST